MKPYAPPTAYGQAKAGRPARTYIQQLCEDTGCSPKDLPKAMDDREKRRERVRDIRASGTTWWMMMIWSHLNVEINTWKYIIISIRKEYLKPWQYVNYLY